MIFIKWSNIGLVFLTKQFVVRNFAPSDFERSRLAGNFRWIALRIVSPPPHTSAEKRYIVSALKGAVRETVRLIVYWFTLDSLRHVMNNCGKITMQDDIFPAAEKILSDIESVVKKNSSL